MAEGTWVPPPKDWTETYQYWDKCDVEDEEVQQAQKMSEQRMRNYLESPGAFMGHDHDHSVERKLLEKSEPEKMAYCENHRRLGNYLFLESIFPKAAEQYQLALSYYEYCFPTDEATMQELDDVRHACLCNISLCYYRMKQWRLAVQAATEVLQEDAGNVKALYRRAQAHRALDEYEAAEQDITKALALCPGDRGITRELRALHAQRRSAAKDEKVVAMHMLGDAPKPKGKEYTAADLAAEEQHETLLHFSAPSVGAAKRPQRPAAAAIRAPETVAFDCLNVAVPLEPVLPPGLLL